MATIAKNIARDMNLFFVNNTIPSALYRALNLERFPLHFAQKLMAPPGETPKP
jgi:hypothetical protein